MPKISIAIPVYISNNKDIDYLEKSFEIIKNQSFKDYEVIVSDNSLNEFVKNICDKYSKYFSLLYKKNSEYIGMSANSNYAMDLCSGEYIKILHCDDFLFSNKSLEIIVECLDNNPNKYWLVNGFNHTRDGKNFFDERIPQYPKHLLIGNNLLGCPSNVTIRNKDIEYFDPNVNMGMDVEWYHRLRMKYGMPIFLEKTLVSSTIHDNSATSKIKFDVEVSADGTSWGNLKSELDYLQQKHKSFFENWEYPNG